MRKALVILLLIISSCSKDEEIPLINGTWTAEEETNFFFYEYSIDLYQVGDSLAVPDHSVIATFREPREILWTQIEGNIDGDHVYLKFRDGSGFVVFDGFLDGDTITTSKFYGYYFGGEYEEELRSEVIFTRE